MAHYLSYTFEDSESFVNTYDELPLWSASFGLLLFKHLELPLHITAVDIGSGAGFPLLELAERLGSTCRVYGVDPWANACTRARKKMEDYGITNVEVLQCSAASIPLDDASADLVVSNLGINNFADPTAVFAECHRILRPGGKLALTTNLFGHWREFYSIFETSLTQAGRGDLAAILKNDEERRGTPAAIARLFTDSGFTVSRCIEDSFEMRFADGSAFLNHHFIKLGWLTTWSGIFPKEDIALVFAALETALNEHAAANGGLKLTVPMAFIEGVKM